MEPSIPAAGLGRSGGTVFDRVPYVSLRSYRRDGGPVDTPVWCAPLDGKLVVFTLRETHKVKRIARDPRVQLARCDVRGKLLGDWSSGSCRQLEVGSELERRAYRAFVDKYGLTMRIGNVLSALSGRMRRRVVLEIALDGESSGARES
jgi:PPOX class probable F420-dependent enzyme